MLINIHLKNLAIIDEIEVDLAEHLNILTGETGAGKSIIIGSINLALGGKISADMVRKGAEYGLVELTFHIEEKQTLQKLKDMEISVEDGILIIARRIKNGRSISKVNGESVTGPVLRELAGLLIDIHGQHEHQSLLYKKKHLEILDQYGREAAAKEKKHIAACFAKYDSCKKKLEQASISEEERKRELSFLTYERDEIQGAGLEEGEDEKLEERYKKLKNSNILAEELGNAYELTAGGSASAGEVLGRAVRIVSHASSLDGSVAQLSEEISQTEALLSDFNRNLSGYMANLEYDPRELMETEERLNLINNLKAKYGSTFSEIKEYYEKIEGKLKKYEDYDNYLEELKMSLETAEKDLKQHSEALSAIRKKKAEKLEKEILEALKELNFLDVRFSVSFQPLNHYTANGFDDVEFLISTNPGEEIKPLGKVASGGELSRIMLAIKSVLAEKDAIDTLIFDEIDTGISGRTAQKVSERLAYIARSHQVISITHLPQIASMADAHYLIEKTTSQNRTATKICLLEEESSVMELARMLGGAKITEAVVNSAREMKNLAAEAKAKH